MSKEMTGNQVDSIAYSRYKTSDQVDYGRFVQTYCRIINQRLSIRTDWRCMDIACGKGNMLAYYRHLGVIDYLGVDLTKNATDVAEREFGSDRVVNIDALEFLANNKNKYELISALDFVEHISKDKLLQFLEMVSYSLSDNGYLLIRTPNPSAPFGMAARYNDITHQTCYSTTAFADIASNFQLKVTKTWEDIGYPRTALQVMQFILWRMLDSVYKTLDFIERGAIRNTPPMTRNYWMLLSKQKAL